MKKRVLAVIVLCLLLSISFADGVKSFDDKIVWSGANYEFVDFLKNSQSLFVYRYKGTSMTGVMDSNFKSIIPADDYTNIELTFDKILVSKNNYFYNPDDASSSKHIYNLYSLKGEHIGTFNYDKIVLLENSAIAYKTNDLWGVMRADGTVIIKPTLAKIEDFDKDNIIVSEKKTGREIYALYNYKGEKVINNNFDYISVDEKRIIVSRGFKFGCYNRELKLISPFIYDYLRDFDGDYAVAGKKINNVIKYGIIDSNFKNVIDFKYDSLYQLDDGSVVFGVKNGNKTLYGMLNKNFKEIIPALYEDISTASDGLLVVKRDGKYGFINLKGELVTKLEYDFLYKINSSLAPFKLNDKWGYLNSKGTVAEKNKFNEAYSFKNNSAIVRNGSFYGLIDSNFKELTRPEYNNIQNASDKLYYSMKYRMNGMLDNFGNTVLSNKYDYINCKEQFIVIQLGDKWGILPNPTSDKNLLNTKEVIK